MVWSPLTWRLTCSRLLKQAPQLGIGQTCTTFDLKPQRQVRSAIRFRDMLSKTYLTDDGSCAAVRPRRTLLIAESGIGSVDVGYLPALFFINLMPAERRD